MHLNHVLLFIHLFFVNTLFGQQPLHIVVDQAGNGDYTTIQEAVYAVRDHFEQPVEIFVRNGIYKEKVVLPAWKRYIHLIGENRDSTIIVFDDFSGKERADSFRKIDKITTYNSYTVLVQSNDVVLKNLTIENSAGPVGQAVALHLEGDRIQVISCNILGYQDTFYLAKEGTRNYVKDCFINGSTDFIFGAATAVFDHCIIESLRNSYITAASTTRETPYGFIFNNCKLVPKDDKVNKVYLGRPWRPYAKTYFINTDLGSHITGEGWHPWPGDKMFPDKTKTADYREYGSFGTGASKIKERVKWAKTFLHAKKADKTFSLTRVFNGWLPNE